MKHFFFSLILSLGSLSFATNTAHADTWNVDSSHSEVGFEVDHMMISTVKGILENFSGSVTTGKKGEIRLFARGGLYSECGYQQ